MTTVAGLGRDRMLSVALILLVVGALLAWPVACSDVGLALTLVFAGLASVATVVLLYTGGPVSAAVSLVVGGLLGVATVVVAALIVALTCSLGATLS